MGTELQLWVLYCAFFFDCFWSAQAENLILFLICLLASHPSNETPWYLGKRIYRNVPVQLCQHWSPYHKTCKSEKDWGEYVLAEALALIRFLFHLSTARCDCVSSFSKEYRCSWGFPPGLLGVSGVSISGLRNAAFWGSHGWLLVRRERVSSLFTNLKLVCDCTEYRGAKELGLSVYILFPCFCCCCCLFVFYSFSLNSHWELLYSGWFLLKL